MDEKVRRDLQEQFKRDREMARRRDHPTRKERLEDFWWAVKDEAGLLLKALWSDLIVPLGEEIAFAIFWSAVIVGIGILLALGFKLVG